MRPDLFYGRKSVHIKLTRDNQIYLRTLCMKYGITMQDVFDELIKSIIHNSKTSEDFFLKVSKKKMVEAIKGKREKMPVAPDKKLETLDIDMLYSLLEEADEKLSYPKGFLREPDKE